MKKLPFFVLCLVSLIFLQHYSGDLNYWTFITHHMVLNISLASIAIWVGYFVKNYLLLIMAASFALVVFCLALIFSPGGFIMAQFFLAIYTVFLGFSAIANLCRHYKDWILLE